MVLKFEFSSQFCSGKFTMQDFTRNILGYYGKSIPLTNLTLSLYNIVHVVSMRTNIKMFGINTASVIAFMQYMKATWYRTNKQYPCAAMRIPTWPTKTSVTIGADVTRPKPACFSLLNIIKEPAFHWRTLSNYLEVVN